MAKRSPWWRGATMYQIYVRSWRDSNGDGIGDLVGVYEGLDYLESLGVEAIWLSPTMPSPNTDWGYDVSDYCDVHPDLGTLADLDRLVKGAAERGISVLLDLVPNHTSSEHPWFIDALSGVASAHRGYYLWARPKQDGSPPNNWLDTTGAPAWSYDERSGEYYLHNFLPTQPDLNWWEQAVHDEFDQILEFWFGRGIAGFRIDVAHGLYKDAELRQNPAALPSDHPATLRGEFRTVYNSHRPEVHKVYQRWRQISDSYDPERALLGETWEFDYKRLGDYYGRGKPELHLNFNFPFVMARLRAKELAGVVEATLSALPDGATPVWTASNHDVGRFPTRWCEGDARAVKAALTVLASLPGNVVLYYGDELGMEDVDVPLELQLDETSLLQPGQPSRDRCRTPMPWTAAKHGGFTAESARPWLPLGDHATTNVESERAAPSSVLNFWKQLAALRRAGRIGNLAPLGTVALDDHVWAFRVGDVTTVANLSGTPAKADMGGAGWSRLISTHAGHRGGAGALSLRPWEAQILAPGNA